MRIAVVALAACAACSDPHAGDADHPSSVDAPAPLTDGATTTADAPPGPAIDLSRTALVIVVGASTGAGYDAPGRTGSGGQGYARQIVDNHPSHPDWANRSLRALRPDVQLRDLAESGATSADARARVQGALGGLPPEVDRDVLVLIHVGGNDFNDDIATMIDPNVAMQRAAALRANLADIIGRLRARYDHPA